MLIPRRLNFEWEVKHQNHPSTFGDKGSQIAGHVVLNLHKRPMHLSSLSFFGSDQPAGKECKLL